MTQKRLARDIICTETSYRHNPQCGKIRTPISLVSSLTMCWRAVAFRIQQLWQK